MQLIDIIRLPSIINLVIVVSYKPPGPVDGQTGFVMNLTIFHLDKVISQMCGQQEMTLTMV
jgi:hypothetical protein